MNKFNFFESLKSTYFIAEIGVNHNGEMDVAKKLIDKAVDCGANAVKFQSYNTNRYTSTDNGERFHRLNRYSLSLEAIKRLKFEADKLGLTLLSTPLTEDWVEPLSNICPILKIASGDINFTPLLEKAAKSKKPIILSTGAANIEEIDKAVSLISNFVGNSKLFDKLTLMHCISAYPAPLEQANILSIQKTQTLNRLSENFYLIPSNKKRNSDSVLKIIKSNKDSTEKILEIRDIALRFLEFEDKREYKIEEFFNKSMRESWLIKKSMSQIMSSSLIEQYELINKLIPNNWIRLIGAGNGGYFLISSKIEEDKIRNLSTKNGLKGIFKAKPSDEGLTAHTI